MIVTMKVDLLRRDRELEVVKSSGGKNAKIGN